ncbi:MAG: MarR family transcriptional regulator [bacterium]|nr:MarR family transcriptional regulator [bacterium]
MGRLLDVNLDSREEMLVAWPRLLIVAGELSARTGEHLIFGRFGLTIPKYSLLATLEAHGGKPSMTELREANFVMVSPSSITALVDDLEARSLVRRVPSPSDRRVSLLEITADGRRLLGQVSEQYQRTMAEFAIKYDMDHLRTAIIEVIQFIRQCGEALGISEPQLPSNGE